MVKKPATIPASELAALIKRWRPGIITDPIDMEHVVSVDPALFKQLTAARLEAHAQVQRTLADAATKAAQLIKSRG